MDYAQLITVLAQIGLGGAAWRLASKIDKRQQEIDKRQHAHEKTDEQFQAMIMAHLGMM